ncbi:GntR family transcriptional regulator [Paenibacillus antri]|uniref:GntR family transcriptional regulator n=1 Tax=Paenibacillus antri TaxID=2582848 RepID=UPI003082D3DA
MQQEIKRQIRDGALRPGDRVPSEKELAAQYGVSQITSKNALLGLVEEGLLVRFQGKGTFVRMSEGEAEQATASDDVRSTIALILPTMKTKVDQRLLDGIERYCSEAGYELLVRITRESQEEEAKAIERFRERGVDGFIIFPVENESYNDAILRLSLDRVPLVLIDRFLREIKTYSVSSANLEGTCAAVTDLIGRGHRSIVYLSPEITNSVTDERAKGFEQALVDSGLPIDKQLWCMLSLETIAKQQAYDEILRFLEGRPEATAVFAVNSELARYAYAALRSLRKRVPTDVELVAFDAYELDGVSVLAQREDEMSRMTVELLAEQLQGTFRPRRLMVPVDYRKV